MNAFMFNVLIFTPMIPTAQPGTPINQHQLYQSGFLASRLPAISPDSIPSLIESSEDGLQQEGLRQEVDDVEVDIA